ncbi:hypothetical protein MW290_18705 [Aquincola tertiaricarbonis]|uniref:Uncharacterized protein n=1 Tax=Aquincola tertiaricarbonis TaxID=391953 RepID=A0ABY4SI59_AQUTE|nr:hypothetical protein [Aquincola tertiaricarbonis]URI11000.1 hypothetical protein MW290_18695 [Aquincola tertiaricarbonis]URI11002.1 hypothetical protein MW290_18705 [Aquincola tertiaricarbonis]
MDAKLAKELGSKIQELQALMVAFATDGRTSDQPRLYRELYADVTIELEKAKYENPNPHKSLEVFYAHCKLQEMKKYAERRACVEELYSAILLDLKRVERHAPNPRNWAKANDVLTDELSPVRTQWLKAKNFIFSKPPDYENSIKESISAVESCLMVLLHEPNGTLGKIIKQAKLDPDIERLVSQAYGYASNKDFVRHGGTEESKLTKAEADFFLDFSASSIVYITCKIKRTSTDA